MIKRKLVTLWRLGLHNLIWVASYRFALKIGLIKKLTPVGLKLDGPFFDYTAIKRDEALTSLNLKHFGWIDYSKEATPEWGVSVVSGKKAEVQNLHWSRISDFDLNVGDVKSIWEMSRFDWLFYFVVEYIKTGDESYLTTLNKWLEDWSENNPVNQGVNWKCGQETSIRVMHLCLASLLLNRHKRLLPSIVEMLEQHLSRISPTLLYAMAQDNNHGSSEAVALYVGGLLLEQNTNSKQAIKWKKQGRFWIENRAKRLIASDGSFSQHSVNYHRLMLDSFCLAELFRSEFNEPSFSQRTVKKFQMATHWLDVFTDELNGNVPNMGANDGAKLIPLSNTDYRDYRSTVQLASVLFLKKRAYKNDGSFNQPLKLLGLTCTEYALNKDSEYHFSEGGYCFINKGAARLFIRYPKFNFRPSQCDALHVDLWLHGLNVLRDAGSYSYNVEEQWMNYFPSTRAHNTVQFDSVEQMPRISRFLYSDWLKADICSGLVQKNDSTVFKAGYTGLNEVGHTREVVLSESSLRISDEIKGFENQAVLRWRLPPGKYVENGYVIIADDFKLVISANVEIKRFEIVEGWESLYYFKKTGLSVLEVEVSEPATISTKIDWK